MTYEEAALFFRKLTMDIYARGITVTLILARVVDRYGNILNPPHPTHILLDENGNITKTYLLREIERFAVAEIERQHGVKMEEPVKKFP